MSNKSSAADSRKKVCIVGAGPTGLTAAYRLSARGFDVTVIEKNDTPGGLARAIPIGNTRLERFYHHLFTSDTDIASLIDELGLSAQLKWETPKNGIYTEGKLRPFTSPLDLLKFNVMPLAARISTGLLVLKARSVKNWKDFESINARDWLVRNSGAASYEKLWGPLLKSKFGSDAEKVSAVWIWNKFKLRGSSRGKNISSEMLGYLEDSFSLMYDRLVEKIEANGGRISFNEEVRKIDPADNGSFLVTTAGRSEKFDIVLASTYPGILAEIASSLPGAYLDSLKAIKYKADLCVILELKEKLTPYYWITVAESDSPFVIIVEQTNLFPNEKYGSSIVYLSRYLDVTDELYNLPDQKVLEIYMKTLKKMFPSWDSKSVKAAHISRARYTQPVVTLGYSKVIPPYETPLENLYLASMAQVYPEDRGQNYAIRSGNEVADLIISKFKHTAGGGVK